MYRGQSIGVVVPVYNEEDSIAQVLETMPDFVDGVLVVDDASDDGTAQVLQNCSRKNLHVIRHNFRGGVGAAIRTGYRSALERDYDCVAVMAGDGQMAPDDLPDLLDPLIENRADYVKGNRFAHPDVRKNMPWERYQAGRILGVLTRGITGYMHISDTQCGYTTIRRETLERLDLDRMYEGYGVPNSLLLLLSLQGARVAECMVQPVYHRRFSHMNLKTLPFTLGWLFVRLAGMRVRHEAIRRLGGIHS